MEGRSSPEPAPEPSASAAPWWRRAHPATLLIAIGVIGVALIVVPIVLLLIGQTADRSLERVASEVDPVSIRLGRVHVDIVRLVDEGMRATLAENPNPNSYDRASTRYIASRALLNSAARGTPYEQEVAAVFVRTDEAAAITAAGVEATQAGDQAGAREQLVGRGASVMEDVAASVAALQNRLDADGDQLRDHSRRLSNFELVLGVGGSLLGAVTVLSLLAVEFARRRLQFERERAGARFAGMVEATGFGVVELDRDRRVEYANPAAAEMLGYPAGMLLGVEIAEFIGPIEEAEEVTGLAAALLQNEAFFGEVVLAARHGSPVVLEVSCAPLFEHTDDGVGAPYGTVLVFQDMTERLEREREQAEFLALASHELRTPLTSLLGFSRRLRRATEQGRLKVDQDTREEIETLNHEAERMRDTIALFLDMSRLDANILELESLPVEVSAVVDEEVDALRQHRPDARVTVEHPDEEPEVPSDEQRVRQIVANLLDNAAKYGGSPPRIEVEVSPELGGVAIYVRDHGQGIDPDDQPYIFDRFYRSQRAKERQGLGLGLHIAKQLAEHLGATLTFSSELGNGTQFRFWLPNEPPPPGARRYSSPARLTLSRRS